MQLLACKPAYCCYPPRPATLATLQKTHRPSRRRRNCRHADPVKKISKEHQKHKKQINFSDRNSLFMSSQALKKASHRLTTALALKFSAFKTNPLATPCQSRGMEQPSEEKLKTSRVWPRLCLSDTLGAWLALLSSAGQCHPQSWPCRVSKIPVISKCKLNLHPKVNITTTNNMK